MRNKQRVQAKSYKASSNKAIPPLITGIMSEERIHRHTTAPTCLQKAGIAGCRCGSRRRESMCGEPVRSGERLSAGVTFIHTVLGKEEEERQK